MSPLLRLKQKADAAKPLVGSNVGYEHLVGYTRLGNLLGLLDREEIAEAKRHLVWDGR